MSRTAYQASSLYVMEEVRDEIVVQWVSTIDLWCQPTGGKQQSLLQLVASSFQRVAEVTINLDIQSG